MARIVRRWTEEEDEYLRRNYVPGEQGSAKAIAAALQRPPNSISYRAHVLGFAKKHANKPSKADPPGHAERIARLADLAARGLPLGPIRRASCA